MKFCDYNHTLNILNKSASLISFISNSVALVTLFCPGFSPKIKKSETQIKWDQEAKYIILSIRAFSPSPGAFTYLKSKRVRIFEATCIKNNQESLSPGVIKIINKEIIVGTLDVPIKILKVQIEGKGVVDSKSFINGYLNRKGYNYIFETR